MTGTPLWAMNALKCEWKLQSSIFQATMMPLGPCTVDHFASRLNNQLPLYMSWRPDPYAMATDAFTVSWVDLGRCIWYWSTTCCTVLTN